MIATQHPLPNDTPKVDRVRYVKGAIWMRLAEIAREWLEDSTTDPVTDRELRELIECSGLTPADVSRALGKIVGTAESLAAKHGYQSDDR